jgi:hypothetical protein
MEQLNSYIVQLLCSFCSPSAKPKTALANVLFTEADLASHVLWMCSLTWQDHFNLHKKGMTPMDMRSLLMSLEAIEGICLQEKSNSQSSKKASNKGEKGNKGPGTESTARVPKIACTEKHGDICKKHGSVHTTHNTSDFCMKKLGQRKPISVPPRKEERNPILQLTLLHR